MLTYTHIASNKRKTAILITGFLLAITAMGYLFGQVYNNPSIVIFAFLFSVFSAFISYFYSDKITLAISNAKPVDKQVNRELYQIVENLAITAGLPTPRIYIIQDETPNAFATGRNPDHAVVCVTTGLLEILDRSELEGVIAHELSHIGNYDIRLMTIVVVLVGVLTLLADWFMRFSLFGGNRRSNDSEGGGQIKTILFIVGIIFAVLSPIIAVIIQLSISRKREYLADASGALLTRYPEGLASALEKLKKHQGILEDANKATAHLYIINPLKDNEGNSAGFFSKLFNTHPPLEDRIKRLREMDRG
jgi:heat shock protein HtpX